MNNKNLNIVIFKEKYLNKIIIFLFIQLMIKLFKLKLLNFLEILIYEIQILIALN